MSKDARYFKHDSGARHDPKVEALINKYGIEGYGRYWVLLEMMREASFYRLETEEYVWGSISKNFKCSIEEAKKFVEDCVNEFKLFVIDKEHGFLYSISFCRRMDKLDAIREKCSKAGIASWESRK